MIQDINYLLRLTRKRPGPAVLSLLTIALGVGVNVGVFTVVNSALLRPPPYANGDRVVSVGERRLTGAYRAGAVSTLNYLDWRAQNTVFDDIAAWSYQSGTLALRSGPQEVTTLRVTGSYFRVFGATALYGRTILPGDETGQERVVVLSHALWASSFGSDPSVIGRTVRIDGDPHVVIGVLPAGMSFDLSRAQLWVPLEFDSTNTNRDFHWLFCVAALERGVSIERARVDLDTIARRLAAAYPATNNGRGVAIEPEAVNRVGPDFKASLYLVFAVVAVVLAIACVNLTSATLTQGLARQHELAIRSALGATRRRLAGQLFVESVALSLAGGVIALPIAHVTVRTVRAFIPQDALPLDVPIALDGPMVLLAFGVAIATGVIVGIVPAIWATRPSLTGIIAEGGGRGSTWSRAQRRARTALVVVEVTLAFVMLTSAGLLLESVWKMRQMDTGFIAEHVLTAEMPVSERTYREPAQLRNYLREVVSKIQTIPGVTGVALTDALPMEMWRVGRTFQIAGQPAVTRSNRPACALKVVSASYRATVGLRLVSGRFLSERDTAEAPFVTVINDTMARKYFGPGSPVGRRILMQQIPLALTSLGPERAWEIVGVVADERVTSLAATENAAVVYVTNDQNPTLSQALAIKTALDPSLFREPVRQAVLAVNEDQALTDVKTLEEIKSAAFAPEAIRASLVVAFGLVALALATMGVYGVIAHSVLLRTREIGIRAALGATMSRLHALFFREVLIITGAGIAIGLVAARTSSRLIASVLFGVASTDPTVSAAAALIVFLVAVAACWLPVRRALKSDLVSALRAE